MTDVTIMLFITAIAFILLVLNFWMRQGALAIIASLCFFIVAAYCMTMYYSPDPDYGIWTWAFVFVAIIGAVIAGLTPNYFKPRYVEEDEKPKTSQQKYTERMNAHKERTETVRNMRPKKKDDYTI